MIFGITCVQTSSALTMSGSQMSKVAVWWPLGRFEPHRKKAALPPCDCTRRARIVASSEPPKLSGLSTTVMPSTSLACGVQHVDQFLVCHEVDGLAHLLALVGDAEGLCDALADVVHLLDHVVVDFARLAAHFKLHHGLRGDDVAAFARDELADVDAGHAAGVTRDAEHLHDGVAGRGEGVAAVLRRGA